MIRNDGRAGRKLRPLSWVALAASLALFASPRVTLAQTATSVITTLPDTVARGITTVILVRHAERDTLFAGTDQPLSAVGILRAKELARVVGDVKFDAIYTTRWARTRQTALPVVAAANDSIRLMDGTDFRAQAEMLRTKHAGQTVLVVGHSDSVPQLVWALTGVETPPLGHLEYDTLWMVTIAPDGATKAMKLRYGAKTPGK